MKKSSIELYVEFADLDGMRAVYHTNYIKWFDYARTKLYREAGFHQDKWEEGGVLMPLVECHCEYKAGAYFKDHLRVTASVKELKRKTITLYYEIENLDTQVITTTGHTVQVFCDENGKPFILEEKFPELVKNLSEE